MSFAAVCRTAECTGVRLAVRKPHSWIEAPSRAFCAALRCCAAVRIALVCLRCLSDAVPRARSVAAVGPAAHARRRALRPPPARADRARTREHSLRLTCSVSAASAALAASPLAPGCACGTTAPLRGPSVRLLHVACCRVRAVRGVVLGCVLECCALHLCVLLWRCKQEWAAYNDQKVLDYQSIGRPSDANRTPIGRQVAAGCNTHTATCNTHTATCSTHTATCTLQHAICSTHTATCNTHTATCST